jgi:ubiquitin conjugation factor E4 B
MQKVRAAQLTFEAQLLEPEFVFQALGFTHFLSTWVIRQAEPSHKHPNPQVT